MQPNKTYLLSLHYNRSSSFLFVNATKIYQFKTKGSEIRDYTMFLSNTSKGFTINNIRKTGLKGIVHCFCELFFSIDIHPIDTKDILDIHRHLIKEK